MNHLYAIILGSEKDTVHANLGNAQKGLIKRLFSEA